MTRHSLIRSVVVLGIRATVVGLAGSVAAPALAANGAAPSHTRSSHPDVVAQSGVIQPAPIHAALSLLRWPADQTPVIVVVAEHPQVVNPLAQAWVVYDTNGRAQPTIYVAGWSALYRDALANPHVPHNIIRLAGVLAHERVHIRHGPDEELAYAEQLTTLERLHAEPIEITNVRRALVESVRRRRLHDLRQPPERGRQSAVLPNPVIGSTSPKFRRHAPLPSRGHQKQLAFFRLGALYP